MLDKIDAWFEQFLADLDELMEARTLSEYLRITARQMGRNIRRDLEWIRRG